MRGTLGHPDDQPLHVLQAIARGHAQGARAELLFGVDWSAHWHRPLVTVQRELGLHEGTERGAIPAHPPGR